LNTDTNHSSVHCGPRKVQSADDEGVGVDHGQDIGKGYVDVLGRGQVVSIADGRGTKKETNAVRLLDA
jgi:hypothetical protein